MIEVLTLPPKYGRPNAVYPWSLAAFRFVHSVVDVTVTGAVPDPNKESNEDRKMAMKRSLEYMGLKANTKISDIKIDKRLGQLYK